MLAQKNDFLVRNENGEETLYRVLLADEECFCVGKTTVEDDEDGETHLITSYENTQIYSNNENIGCLKDYGFKKV